MKPFLLTLLLVLWGMPQVGAADESMRKGAAMNDPNQWHGGGQAPHGLANGIYDQGHGGPGDPRDGGGGGGHKEKPMEPKVIVLQPGESISLTWESIGAGGGGVDHIPRSPGMETKEKRYTPSGQPLASSAVTIKAAITDCQQRMEAAMRTAEPWLGTQKATVQADRSIRVDLQEWAKMLEQWNAAKACWRKQP